MILASEKYTGLSKTLIQTRFNGTFFYHFAAMKIMRKSRSKNLAADAPRTAAEWRTLPVGYFVHVLQAIFVKLDWKKRESGYFFSKIKYRD